MLQPAPRAEHRVALGLMLAIAFAPALEAQPVCGAAWDSGFGAAGADGDVLGMVTFDDGAGPKTFAWGWFSTIGGFPAWRFGIWDGSTWSAPGIDPSFYITAMAVHDDGTGPAVWVAARGTHAVTFGSWLMRWNGSTFDTVAPGLTSLSYIWAMASFDDGSGPALYCGGNGVNRWNASGWTPVAGALGIGILDGVLALAAYDAGAGPRLYAGGNVRLGPASGPNVAQAPLVRWDGTAWSTLPPLNGALTAPFVQPLPGVVRSLVSGDDGNGPGLFVGGRFALAGGMPASNVVKWNGSAYAALGSGFGNPLVNLPDAVRVLAFVDLGQGPRLLAGGTTGPSFNGYATVQAWDGVSWLAGLTLPGCSAAASLAAMAGASSPTLLVGGIPDAANVLIPPCLSAWNGSAWSVPSAGAGVNGPVRAFAVHDSGGGRTLHAGGDFDFAGALPAPGIAAWTGGGWQGVGGGVGSGTIEALASFDDGSGPRLYAGGSFRSAGGFPIAGLASWNGSAWASVGSGLASSPAGTRINSIVPVVLPGARGLVVGGSFSSIGGTTASGVAVWNGTSYVPLGAGVAGEVRSLCVHDDGTGLTVYAGGTMAAGVERWDGVAWVPVGNLMGGNANPVEDMLVFDDGSGPALYATGGFRDLSVPGTYGIARWRNGAWSPVGLGMASTSAAGRALAVFDDGRGPALYAGGNFQTIGGVAASLVARWDGTAWSPVGEGVSSPNSGPTVRAMIGFDDGFGPALWTGGTFASAGPFVSRNIARWHAPRPYLELVNTSGTPGGVLLRNAGLVPGNAYANLFSLDAAAGPAGLGPILGLYASDPSFLLAQWSSPAGTLPFHFSAPGSSTSFGPFLLPPGLVIDTLCIDRSGGTIGCVGPVRRFTVN